MSVVIKPGSTRLTRIPRLPTSLARDLVNPINPAFEAEYAHCPVFPCEPTRLPTLTTQPPHFVRIIPFSTAFVNIMVPTRLVLITEARSLVFVRRSNRSALLVPALLTRMFGANPSSSSSLAALRRLPSEPMSQLIAACCEVEPDTYTQIHQAQKTGERVFRITMWTCR